MYITPKGVVCYVKTPQIYAFYSFLQREKHKKSLRHTFQPVTEKVVSLTI